MSEKTVGVALTIGIEHGGAAKWYPLILLMLANMANIIDRNIFAVILQPIKLEFGLSDSAIGALQGLPFSILYIGCGIPLAVLADRSNRRNIMIGALSLFSVLTLFCGMAGSFVQLFLARMGVAIGEAGCSPTAQSMVSDICPPKERGRGLSVYAIGLNLGILFGFALGGWIAQLWGWRWALIVAGLPGILIAGLMMLTMQEPIRGRFDPPSESKKAASFLDVVRWLWARRSFRHIAFGALAMNLSAAAFLNWSPTFLARSFAMKPGEIGMILAIIVGVLGSFGTYGYGLLYDWLNSRNHRWQTWLPSVACLIVTPFTIGFLLAESSKVAIVLMVLPALFFSAYIAQIYAVTHNIVLPHMRSTASAIVLGVLVIVGQGLGGQVVGGLSDLFRPWAGNDSLRFALVTMAIGLPIGAYQFWKAARYLAADIASAQQATGGSLPL